MIVFNEASLYQHVKVFVSYYHRTRTHLSLAKDTPETRPVHPPELGPVVAIAEVGGLHHRYERPSCLRNSNTTVLAYDRCNAARFLRRGAVWP
jgi:hypothetical protein